MLDQERRAGKDNAGEHPLGSARDIARSAVAAPLAQHGLALLLDRQDSRRSPRKRDSSPALGARPSSLERALTPEQVHSSRLFICMHAVRKVLLPQVAIAGVV